MAMREDKLSKKEKKRFDQLPREKEPPKKMEKFLLHRLDEEGLLTRKSKKQVYVKWAISVAASLLLFVSGIFYERLNSSDIVLIEPSKGYMLLLHEDNSFVPAEPKEMFYEYKNWMESTFERGVKITGQELKDEAVLVNQDGQSEVKNHERTTGYFILEAKTLGEAIKVAQENPHIKYGGTIEVKQYMVR